MGFQLENIQTVKKTKEKHINKTSFLQKEMTFFGTSFSNKIKEDFYTNESQKDILITGINPSFREGDLEGSLGFDFQKILYEEKYDNYLLLCIGCYN